MTANPFTVWLAEVARDGLVVRPDDIEAEARGNLWSFSLTRDQAAAVCAADVEKFAAGVAEVRRATLAARQGEAMVLYWWHDAPAGQLRFSIVSASHGRLPFACEVTPTASISEIAADWLGSSCLHGIPRGELWPLAKDELVPEPPPLVLRVWTQRVP